MGLAISGVCAWYGQAQALWDVRMDVPTGAIVGVLGRNGAGKSTLLRSVAGLHSRIAGELVADGMAIAGLKADTIARRGVSFVREAARLPASLSVLQNLQLGQGLARMRGKTGRPIEEVWKWFPILKPLKDRTAGLLSGGQRQALALATALVSDPSILLLDEPSAGLAPPVARELFSSIRRLAGTGITVLIVEQQPGWLTDVANHCYLLEVGRVVAQGSVESLIGSSGDALDIPLIPQRSIGDKP